MLHCVLTHSVPGQLEHGQTDISVTFGVSRLGNYGLLGVLDYTHQTDAEFQAHKRAQAGVSTLR